MRVAATAFYSAQLQFSHFFPGQTGVINDLDYIFAFRQHQSGKVNFGFFQAPGLALEPTFLMS
jgi:hypothetical protein